MTSFRGRSNTSILVFGSVCVFLGSLLAMRVDRSRLALTTRLPTRNLCFTQPFASPRPGSPRRNFQQLRLYASVREKAQADVKQMTARQIKEELKEKGIDPSGIFEKQDLVNLLADARIEAGEITDFDRTLKQAQDFINKAGNEASSEAKKTFSNTFATIKNFDLKEELQKQADKIKENIQENVDWYGSGEKNPFAEGRQIRKQRGYYRGGDKL
mmetsp:Transcript_27129/g.37762  ORF Transcript_27129/g.37762 Transcript_27129/m.37762 type:complete len:214 (+) Transcript_27129:254-895(+)